MHDSCKPFFFFFVPSGSRRFHRSLWCRTGRAGGRWSFPAYLHRSAWLGASQASRVPRVPLGDPYRASGEEQPQCECVVSLNTKVHVAFFSHCLTTCGFLLGGGSRDGHHRSGVPLQHTGPVSRPGASSGSPASGPGSTEPQEQCCAQELHSPPACTVRE